jgi:NAD(P)H-flavin reductase
MDNAYIPKVVRIESVFKETPDVKTVSLKYPLDFIPGQFLEVSSFGVGEAPISISSDPCEKSLQISFRCVGKVTESLFNFKKGDSVGIRGPFGNGFPLKEMEGKDLVFIAGGIGIAPLRSLLKFILSQKEDKFGSLSFLYGARTPQDMLYKKDLINWAKQTKVLLTVDRVDKRDAAWEGPVGVATQLLDKITIDPFKTKAILCGPEKMMHFSTVRLLELGMRHQDIILSLERHMKCGVGKCGHCYTADKFVCRDGPIFTCAQLKSLVPKEDLR